MRQYYPRHRGSPGKGLRRVLKREHSNVTLLEPRRHGNPRAWCLCRNPNDNCWCPFLALIAKHLELLCAGAGCERSGLNMERKKGQKEVDCNKL